MRRLTNNTTAPKTKACHKFPVVPRSEFSEIRGPNKGYKGIAEAVDICTCRKGRQNMEFFSFLSNFFPHTRGYCKVAEQRLTSSRASFSSDMRRRFGLAADARLRPKLLHLQHQRDPLVFKIAYIAKTPHEVHEPWFNGKSRAREFESTFQNEFVKGHKYQKAFVCDFMTPTHDRQQRSVLPGIARRAMPGACSRAVSDLEVTRR